MKPVPASRYIVFALIAGGGLFWDLWTKHIVFRDLGYPASYVGRRIEPVPGEHTLFDAPTHVEGVSDQYLQGWTSFWLLTSFNEGALWGIGQGWTWLFALLSIAAACGVFYWLFVYGAAISMWLTVALSLIMAGTLGNLWDRMALHDCVVDNRLVFGVRDFLLFTFGEYNWPVFNFADVFLVTGAIMLVLQSFLSGPDSPTGSAEAAKKSSASTASSTK
jgi:signal peptidase II